MSNLASLLPAAPPAEEPGEPPQQLSYTLNDEDLFSSATLDPAFFRGQNLVSSSDDASNFNPQADVWAPQFPNLQSLQPGVFMGNRADMPMDPGLLPQLGEPTQQLGHGTDDAGLFSSAILDPDIFRGQNLVHSSNACNLNSQASQLPNPSSLRTAGAICFPIDMPLDTALPPQAPLFSDASIFRGVEPCLDSSTSGISPADPLPVSGDQDTCGMVRGGDTDLPDVLLAVVSQNSVIDLGDTLDITTSVPDTAMTVIPPHGKAGYAPRSAWECKRLLLQVMYLELNLNLQDIMDIMESRHGFRASINMYKKQFRRWNWRKYKSTQHLDRRAVLRAADEASSQHTSCIRRADLRQKALLHESESDRIRCDALSSLRDFFCIEKTSDWLLGLAGDGYRSALNCALNHLNNGNLSLGGAYLRKAFIALEPRLRNLSAGAAFIVFVQDITELIHFGREDILAMYLDHIAQLSVDMASYHPTGYIASRLRALQNLGTNQLVYFASIAGEMHADCLVDCPEVETWEPLISRTFDSIVQSNCLHGYVTSSVQTTARKAVLQLEAQVRAREIAAGQLKDGCGLLETLVFDQLQIQRCAEVYLDTFPGRAEWLADQIRGRNGLSANRDCSDTWDPNDGQRYIFSLVCLCEYFAREGPTASARPWLRKILAIIESPSVALDMRDNYLFELIRDFLECGLHEEADELKSSLSRRNNTMMSFLAEELGELGLEEIAAN